MSDRRTVMLVDMPGWQGGAAGNRPYPNVGIAYLVPVLEHAGFSVQVVDMNNDAVSDEDLVSAVSALRPVAVGFSVKTATARNAKRLGELLKGRFPSVPILVGGAHATVAAEAMIGEPWVDGIVIGEAEEILPGLCRSLEQGRMSDHLPGVLTKHADTIASEMPAQVGDLDVLPLPDYSKFSSSVSSSIAQSYPLVTSRGCVYRCTYCSVPKISGNRLRKRSLIRLMDELRHAKETYHITGFEIVDDAFNADMDRSKQFCRILIDAGLALRWSCPNGLRADRVDSELAGLMARAGCFSVMVGIESADPEILASVKKGESIEDIERGIRIFQTAGISVGGYFIIGLPGDSLRSQRMSVAFAKRTGIQAHFNMLIPYPRTELWEWMQKNARFLLDIEDGMHFADTARTVCPVVETEEFTAEDRMKAYEMTHTLLGQFHMVIPRGVGRWTYFRNMTTLIWKYDRPRFLFRMFEEIVKQVSRGWSVLLRGVRPPIVRR